MACCCGDLIFAGQGSFLLCLGLHACAWAGMALFSAGGSDLQACRYTPAFGLLPFYSSKSCFRRVWLILFPLVAVAYGVLLIFLRVWMAGFTL